MSMQPYPQNPIELKKQQTRRNARRAVACVGGGIGVGAALGLILTNFGVFVVFLVLGLGGGAYFGSKVQKAIAKDPQSPY